MDFYYLSKLVIWKTFWMSRRIERVIKITPNIWLMFIKLNIQFFIQNRLLHNK